MAVFLSPVGGAGAQFFDNNGNPLTGGKLYTYAAGTTTPAVTYISSAGTTVHSNPIVLDAAGRIPGSSEIWLTDSIAYKFVLKTSDDVLLATWDNIAGINSNFVNFTAQEEVQTATAGQTVFTLVDITYVPGGNNLQVFVDGVNQIVDDSYIETNSTTVTFVSGLHVGALVKFTTAVSNSSGIETDAALVTYEPPFTGGVSTTVETKLARLCINAADFGAIGDGVADDTTALQNALNAATGRTLCLEAGAIYKCTAGLTAYGSIEGNGATLMFYGAAISVLLYTNSAGDLQNFVIDGTNVASCERGLGVNTDFAQTGWNYYNLTVQNISNNDNTQPAEGASFYRFSGATQTTGFFDISVNVFNVTATANGSVGDNGGAAVGLAFGCNGSGTDCNVLIHDCVVKNIAPDEDAIGIYLLTGDHTSASAKGWYVIQDCEVYNSEKYSYKLQAPNVMVRRCLADNVGAACSENFTCYGHNVVYQDCVVRNAQGEGFVSHGPGTVLLNGRVQGNSNSNSVRLYPTATNFRCNGLVIETTATFAAVGFTRLAIDNGNRADFDNVRITGATNTGTAIQIIGTGKVTFSNTFVSGFEIGVDFPYGSVTTWLDTCEISVSGATSYGIYRLGNTANFIRIRDSRILAGFIGIYTNSGAGANSAIVEIDSSSIVAGTHGILAPSNSRITNCVVASDGTLGTGLGAENSVYRNNQITKFLNGVDISFTTTAEMADNVTIGTTNPFVTTGYTPFVNANNNSR